MQDVDFSLLFPDPAAAEEAVARLRELGFISGWLDDAESGGRRVIASRRLSDEELAGTDEELLPELADDLGGEYEGWERTLE